MLRTLTVLLVVVAGGSAIAFVTLYLGGYPWAMTHERMGLAPLIAGLGASVLEGYRRGHVAGIATLLAFTLLAAWFIYLRLFP